MNETTKLNDELTDAELAGIGSGYNCPYLADWFNPVDYAVDYWKSVGFTQTFKDLYYQI